MNMREIGELLRVRREFLNLRQEDLAEMSGVTTRSIHLIEHGKGNPTIETLEKLGTVLGMEIIWQVKKTN